ncbi:MAG: hypothetical protein V1688_00820 [bacterium]
MFTFLSFLDIIYEIIITFFLTLVKHMTTHESTKTKKTNKPPFRKGGLGGFRKHKNNF